MTLCDRCDRGEKGCKIRGMIEAMKTSAKTCEMFKINSGIEVAEDIAQALQSLVRKGRLLCGRVKRTKARVVAVTCPLIDHSEVLAEMKLASELKEKKDGSGSK